ncbi:hypothetical protein BAJUN_01080 [Bajunvirus bajun]|uniref:Cupin domain-containing protein n=1 Tax=Brevundimonas phage vB_BgoS-Bajun TaxID=2948594 RepID=A0A9E7N4I0_9CAUD|nr:hypothetical protein BAJUN_01080 [Brevundimonas phage vB_BgoS-Bajun]
MKFAWRKPGGLPECPYFRLSLIGLFGYSIRVHEWLGDDDREALHDHPHDFATLVLKGGYTDVTDAGREVVRAGSFRFRAAEHRHAVLEVLPGTVTLLFVWPPRRRWGFWVDGKLIKRDKFFVTKGHHGCAPDGPRVRRRPDGTRVT